MAIRTATRRWPDLAAFLREYPQTIKVGALVLPGDTLDGDPAPEMRIDLMIPLVGRVGPITAQLVARLPDGGAALRIQALPEKVTESIRELLGAVDAVKLWLLETGAVAPPGGVAPEAVRALESRVRDLEYALARAAQGAPVQVGAAPVQKPRGFPIPDVSHLEPVLSGVLEDGSIRDAFMALAVEKMTGLLTLRHGGTTRWGFWSKGGPVGWRTEPLDETEVLGVLMYRAGTVTREQLEESLQIMERSGGRQGEAFIELGVLSFPQLILLLQKQVEHGFQKVLRERSGTWTFHVLDELPERFVAPPIRVASILYRALLQHVRELPAQELAATLRPWLDLYIFLAPGVDRTFEEMRLNPEELQFVKIVSTTSYRLREVFAVSSLSRSQTAAAVWCLRELNLIELRGEGASSRGNERAAKDLAQRRAVAQNGTHFDRLDLHWICTAGEVDAGYRKLMADYGPERHAGFGEEHRATLELVARSIQDARDALFPDGARREYRAKVIERGKIEQSAEMLARKGEMAIMKGNGREAMDCFGKSVELVPGNAEYRDGFNRAKALKG